MQLPAVELAAAPAGSYQWYLAAAAPEPAGAPTFQSSPSPGAQVREGVEGGRVCVCLGDKSTKERSSSSLVPFPSLAVRKSSSFFVRTQGEPGNEVSLVGCLPILLQASQTKHILFS